MKSSQISTPDSVTKDFVTKDLALATILKLRGFKLLRIENRAGRGFFFFEEALPDITDLINKFYNGELRMDPRRLFDEWRSLKTQVFNAVDDVK